MDEDYFGSRGSLTVSGKAVGVTGGSQMDIDVTASDDEENEEAAASSGGLAGSRTSLGSSNGLKRWTTEDNLSSLDGGSREGKADLLDETIHDSHSNSTGEKRFLLMSVRVSGLSKTVL